MMLTGILFKRLLVEHLVTLRLRSALHIQSRNEHYNTVIGITDLLDLQSCLGDAHPSLISYTERSRGVAGSILKSKNL